MLLGIDVGGTYTDAVIISQGRILCQAKKPTTRPDLLPGVLQALDEVLSDCDKSGIKRVALSTTIVTNALVEGKTDLVDVITIPGPGLDSARYFPVEPIVLSGYVDHRGRETAKASAEEVRQICRQLSGSGIIAVSGKFSVRNSVQELNVARQVEDLVRPSYIACGSLVSGSLNFIRRTNSAYYNAAVWRIFGLFAQAMENAVRERGIQAPVYILKADGGTLPLELARNRPVETIFTGPAASVMGIMGMVRSQEAAVSIDVGGTTTDIALWQNGLPLFAARGAHINGFMTAVRSFRLRSVGIGGDSVVRRQNDVVIVGPDRMGPAMAVGGTAPTLSDAMIVAGCLDFGDAGRAAQAMEGIARQEQSPRQAAEEVLTAAVDKVAGEIRAMIQEQAAEPVYRVEDIIYGAPFEPQLLIGVGGASPGLAPLIAKKLGYRCHVPAYSMIANALGAALARPTLEITLRADTAQGYYSIAELGERHELPKRQADLESLRRVAERHLAEQAQAAGIDVLAVETAAAEEFHLVRGFSTIGKSITLTLQLKPGVHTILTDGEVAK